MVGKCGRPAAEAVMREVHSPAVIEQVKDSACISEYISKCTGKVHVVVQSMCTSCAVGVH